MMLRYVRLYLLLLRTRIRAQLTYRTSFALDLLSSIAIAALDIVAIFVVFENVPAIGDWSRPQVALLYGLSALTFSLAELTVGELGRLPGLIRSGSFDLLLLRPGGSLFQLATLDFSIARVGRAIGGVAILTYGLTQLELPSAAATVALLALAIPSGAMIFAGVWIIASAVVFWTVDGSETTNAFTYGGHLLTQFPLTIFPLVLRVLFTFVVPLALVAYAPAGTLLDHPAHSWLSGWLAPAGAAMVMTVALATWRACERRYRSAGG